MKNLLHFGKVKPVEAPVGEALDSGNGYYSYSWVILPYSGTITPENRGAVCRAIHNHFTGTFMSVGGWKPLAYGGEILVRLVYHHGD